MRPKTQQWRVIYAVTAVLCLAIGLTTGASDTSHAWHGSAIIVIVGIVALWRLSQTPTPR
jgi:hypothetical protein